VEQKGTEIRVRTQEQKTRGGGGGNAQGFKKRNRSFPLESRGFTSSRELIKVNPTWEKKKKTGDKSSISTRKKGQ